MRTWRGLSAGLFTLLAICGTASFGWAVEEEESADGEVVEETDEEEADEESPTSMHLNTALQWRVVPEGLSIATDLAFQSKLFEGDGLLVKDTMIEGGVTTEFTPSNAWAGLYLEAIPVAFLQLRASIESLSYFGTFGTLYFPESNDGDWSLDALPDGIGAGAGGDGWMGEVVVTPRAKVGSFVFLAETTMRWVQMSVDEPYYESSFDLVLEPTDRYWQTSPTAGWVFEFPKADMWLLTGLQWEHTETNKSDLTLDMGRVLGLVGLPWGLGNGADMEAALLAGYWLNHPNRQNTFYVAGQISIDLLL